MVKKIRGSGVRVRVRVRVRRPAEGGTSGREKCFLPVYLFFTSLFVFSLNKEEKNGHGPG